MCLIIQKNNKIVTSSYKTKEPVSKFSISRFLSFIYFSLNPEKSCNYGTLPIELEENYEEI